MRPAEYEEMQYWLRPDNCPMYFRTGGSALTRIGAVFGTDGFHCATIRGWPVDPGGPRVEPFAHWETAVGVGEETRASEFPQAVITAPTSSAANATGAAQVTESLLRPAPGDFDRAPLGFFTLANPLGHLTTSICSVGPMEDEPVSDTVPAIRGRGGNMVRRSPREL